MGASRNSRGGMDYQGKRARSSTRMDNGGQERGEDEDEGGQVSCKEACCSCFGGVTGICAAFCCCPFAIFPLAGFLCVKIPSKLVKRLATKLTRQPSRKKRQKKLWRMGSSGDMWPIGLGLFGSGRIQDGGGGGGGGDERLGFVESVGFGNSNDWRELFDSRRSYCQD